MNRERLDAALRKALVRLLEMRSPGGFWEGHLSSSALSTATAVSALSVAAQTEDAGRIRAGAEWLAKNQNADGGWGDTPESPSNLSTSLLVSAALKLASGERLPVAETDAHLHEYLNRTAGSTADERREAVCAAYAPDRTFAVPILTNLALAGLTPFEKIPSLPFELAALPSSCFRFLRLHVVSYALPALIAIGLTLERHQPPCFFLRRAFRAASRGKALRKLEEIQPSSGGFLEAVPLTSFVTMSLVPLYGHQHPVARKGLEFLRASARRDGSWPIDTNLSVWLTTAATLALAESGEEREAGTARSWLLSAQHREWHPYTDSAPGGWAWTDRPGGVPDADDTAGAVLALTRLGERGPATAAGLKRLLDLQNADGGWPTFCRGWGRLPFDRSAPDLTAHALRAIRAFDPNGRCSSGRRATARGLKYLQAHIQSDGSWRPLWFGHQAARDLANPVLGTSRVLRALDELEPDGETARRGRGFLLSAQNPDGGWGGEAGLPSTTEETALAVSALSGPAQETKVGEAVERGVFNLVERVESGAWLKPAPIGLYFAKLWYSEEAYPVIWTVEALGRVLTGTGTSQTLSGRGMANTQTNSGDRRAHAT